MKCLRKPPAARAKCLRALPAHQPTRDVESTLGEEGLAARWVLMRPSVEWFNDRGPYGGGTNTVSTWTAAVDADDRPFGDRRRAEALLVQVQQGFGGDLLKALTHYPLVATDTGHLLDGWHRLYLWVKSGLPGGPPTLVMVPGKGGLGRISALCPGKEVGPSVFDHSCLVAKPFSLTVEIGPSGNYLRAALTHPKAPQDKQLRSGEVGFVSGVKSGETLIVGESFITESFRGKGLAVSLYEALFSRAQQLGVDSVAGTAHSTPASMLHRKMAEKHGLKYRPMPNYGEGTDNWETKREWEAAPSGAYDEKWKPYSFPLNGIGPYKQCGCGRAYTKAEWEALPVIGHQLTDDEEGRYDLELRNCPSCDSTMGVEQKTHDGEGRALSGPGSAAPERLEKLKGVAGGFLTPEREAAFARFQDAVRHVWNKPEFVLPVIALSSEEPGNNRNPGGPPVLASVTFVPQGVWAVGSSLLRRAPSYTIRLADRLFALPAEDQWKILVHEAVHLGYPRHSKEFRDLCREKGGTVSEEALDGQGVKAEKKIGSRFQVQRVFTDEKEATRWAKEQQRAEPGSRWRLSLGGVGVEPEGLGATKPACPSWDFDPSMRTSVWVRPDGCDINAGGDHLAWAREHLKTNDGYAAMLKLLNQGWLRFHVADAQLNVHMTKVPNAAQVRTLERYARYPGVTIGMTDVEYGGQMRYLPNTDGRVTAGRIAAFAKKYLA